MGFRLAQVSDRVFGFNTSIPASDLINPLSEISDFAHIPGDSPVYGLMVVGLPPSADSRQNFTVAGVTQLTFSKRAFSQTRTRHDGDDPKSESASESEAEENMNGVGEDSSDADTIASSVESAVCDEVEEHFAAYVAREIPESSEDDDLAQAPRRALVGTHVVENNGFCYMLNDPKYPDVKICLHKRWCTPEHCGTTEKSKQLL